MNNAKQIIERFGGQSALAALLGRRQSTVQHWARTGRIPSQWQRQLLELAYQKGVRLEAKDFVASDAAGHPAGERKAGRADGGAGRGVVHLRRGR